MANSRRRPSDINAGSMADIAFLLLIFFLVVSAIEKEQGMYRKSPKWYPTKDCYMDIHNRNLLTISLNDKNELMVNNDLMALSALKNRVKAFIDNNGDNSCDYCSGKRIEDASDNPKSAVISILISRESSYEWFIKVQDELIAAYFELRKDFVNRTFGKPWQELTESELKLAKEAYPFQISEAELRL